MNKLYINNRYPEYIWIVYCKTKKKTRILKGYAKGKSRKKSAKNVIFSFQFHIGKQIINLI